MNNSKDDLKAFLQLYETLEKNVNKLRRALLIDRLMIVFSLILLIITLVLLLTFDITHTVLVQQEESVTTEEFVEVEQAEPEGDYIELPLVNDIIATKEKPIVTFYCPESNADKFEVKYIFTDSNNEIIAETDWIRSNNPYDLDISKEFPVGATNCNCTINGRYIETQKASNGVVYNITVNNKG